MKKGMVYVSSEQSDRGKLHSVGTYSQIWRAICGVKQKCLLSHRQLRDGSRDLIVRWVNAM